MQFGAKAVIDFHLIIVYERLPLYIPHYNAIYKM